MKHFERFMFCLFVCYHWWPLRTVYTTFHSHSSHLFPFTFMQLFCCQSPAASTSFRSSFRLSVLLWDELECRLSEPGIKPLIFFGTQPALSTALHNRHSHWRQCVFHRGLMGICEVFPNKKSTCEVKPTRVHWQQQLSRKAGLLVQISVKPQSKTCIVTNVNFNNNILAVLDCPYQYFQVEGKVLIEMVTVCASTRCCCASGAPEISIDCWNELWCVILFLQQHWCRKTHSVRSWFICSTMLSLVAKTFQSLNHRPGAFPSQVLKPCELMEKHTQPAPNMNILQGSTTRGSY